MFNLKNWQILTLIALAFIFLVPCILDPYYHKEKVTLFKWAMMELEELRTGERE